MPGQARSNKVKFPDSKFTYKNMLSSPALSQDSKNVIYFIARQLKMPKTAYKKVTSLPLPIFWPMRSQKEGYCFKILHACCVYVS